MTITFKYTIKNFVGNEELHKEPVVISEHSIGEFPMFVLPPLNSIVEIYDNKLHQNVILKVINIASYIARKCETNTFSDMYITVDCERIYDNNEILK